jgi:hypothetical protein
MQKAEGATRLNSFQQAGGVSLKQNALKIGDFSKSLNRLGRRGRAFKSHRPDQ